MVVPKLRSCRDRNKSPRNLSRLRKNKSILRDKSGKLLKKSSDTVENTVPLFCYVTPAQSFPRAFFMISAICSPSKESRYSSVILSRGILMSGFSAVSHLTSQSELPKSCRHGASFPQARQPFLFSCATEIL